MCFARLTVKSAAATADRAVSYRIATRQPDAGHSGGNDGSTIAYETLTPELKLVKIHNVADTVRRRRLSCFGRVCFVCEKNVTRPLCYMYTLQDQEQEEDQGGSGLITCVMIVLIRV